MFVVNDLRRGCAIRIGERREVQDDCCAAQEAEPLKTTVGKL